MLYQSHYFLVVMTFACCAGTQDLLQRLPVGACPED